MRRSVSRPARSGLAVLLTLLVALGTLTGCSADADPTPDGPGAAAIRFGSYDFTENQILVELYAEAARRAGLPVIVHHGIGTREVVAPALQQDVVDVVVDYLGTALAFARGGGQPAVEGTPAELADALAGALAHHGVTVLAPGAAEDRNGFAVTTGFAAEHGVGRLSDLGPLAGGLTFGGPPECPDRPFCLPGLEEVYGLRFGAVLAMPSRAATVEALLSGQIDIGLLETTDARLGVAPIMLLTDDRGLQPPENVVPLVRSEVLDRHGRLVAALDAVSARLTTGDLVRLNRAVELEGLLPAEAAARWWG